MRHTSIIVLFLIVTLYSFASTGTRVERTAPSLALYQAIDFGDNTPSYQVFALAYNGFLLLKEEGKVSKDILSLIDFEQSSTKDRLWVIDLQNKKVLHNTLVAHGRNSGNEFATSFSNVNSSYKSSLGFYVTSSTYVGKHGRSLRLLGVEKNINDAAYDRHIVMHGADYVSKEFAQKYGRIGRSLGCPSVPVDESDEIIDDILEGSCLFIFKKDKNYLTASNYITIDINDDKFADNSLTK